MSNFLKYKLEVNDNTLVDEINQTLARIRAKHRITKEIAQSTAKIHTVEWISNNYTSVIFGYKKPVFGTTKLKIVYEIRSVWAIKKISGTFGELCNFANRLKRSDALEFLKLLQLKVDKKHVKVGEKYDDLMATLAEQPFPGTFFKEFKFFKEPSTGIIARGLNQDVSFSKSLRNVEQICGKEYFTMNLVYSKDRMCARIEKFGFTNERPGKLE